MKRLLITALLLLTCLVSFSQSNPLPKATMVLVQPVWHSKEANELNRFNLHRQLKFWNIQSVERSKFNTVYHLISK